MPIPTITGNKDVDRMIFSYLKGDDLYLAMSKPGLEDIMDSTFWKLKLDQEYPGSFQFASDQNLSDFYFDLVEYLSKPDVFDINKMVDTPGKIKDQGHLSKWRVVIIDGKISIMKYLIHLANSIQKQLIHFDNAETLEIISDLADGSEYFSTRNLYLEILRLLGDLGQLDDYEFDN